MFTRLTILMLAVATTAQAAPQPGVAPKSWLLEYDIEAPQRISIQHPGDDKPTSYWYVLYSVTNKSRDSVDFFPDLHIVTDHLKTIEGNSNISRTVFDAILTRHRKVHPFAVTPMKVHGPLLPGVDNKRTSVFVFREFESDVNFFTIYLGGLSGEIDKIRNPRFDRSAGVSDQNPDFFFVRRTLAIRYAIAGDEKTRLTADPVEVERKWVMR